MNLQALAHAGPLAQATSFSLVYLYMLAVPVAGIAITYLILQQVKHSRDRLHDERIRAIEAGLLWCDPNEAQEVERHANRSFWIAFWLVCFGCGVPFYSVSQWVGPDTDLRTMIFGWIAASITSIAATIGAVLLVIKSRKNKT